VKHTFHAQFSFTFGVTRFDVVKQKVAMFSCYGKVKLGVLQFSKDHVKENYWE